MHSREALLALAGTKAGLAQARVRVNPWSYSGLGSWYELPYINPPGRWGRDVLWSHMFSGQHPGVFPLCPPPTLQRRFHTGVLDSALALHLIQRCAINSRGTRLPPGCALLGGRLELGPGAALGTAQAQNCGCAASMLPRAATLILLHSVPRSWPSLPGPGAKSSSGRDTRGSLKREKAVADPWVSRGCAAGAAALGDTLGAFLSACFPSIPGHQGRFATPGAHCRSCTSPC